MSVGDSLPLHRLIAHVVQSHPVTPNQAGQMAPIELFLYVTPTEDEKCDLGTTVARLEAMQKLTLAQRVELQRRLHS